VLVALLLPLFVLVSILIKLDSPGPVFFRQERIGRNGRPFRIWKLRTMVVGAVSQGAGLFVTRNDPRITRVGALIRRLSIDELPQLLNVLCGEMSLVGPRPTLRYQVEQYDSFQWQRLSMPPGITGWAQVNGRNELSWPERIRLDVWYVRHWSFWLDLRILVRTASVLAGGAGTYNEDRSRFEVSRRPGTDAGQF
jgi:lipopolysaccharide/colanic/teichoic acid biosynthesis glycosyltransferase